MAAGLGLHDAEEIRRTAAPILVVALRHVPRSRGPRRPDVGMQQEGPLIPADHRFLGVHQPFIQREYVLHARDVLGRQLGDTPPFFPATA